MYYKLNAISSMTDDKGNLVTRWMLVVPLTSYALGVYKLHCIGNGRVFWRFYLPVIVFCMFIGLQLLCSSKHVHLGKALLIFSIKWVKHAYNLFSVLTASGNIRQLYCLQGDWYIRQRHGQINYGTGSRSLFSL